MNTLIRWMRQGMEIISTDDPTSEIQDGIMCECRWTLYSAN